MIIAPLPSNEKERISALETYSIMGSAPEKDFDDLTTLAAEICQTPVALVTILGEEKQWFKSRFGTEFTETPKDLSFCSHTILENGGIMVINDTRKDSRFADNPLVSGDTKVIFYAGVPLVNPEGYALGTICVIDHKEKTLNESQINALRILGKQALHQLELRRKMIQLENSNMALSEANSFIEKFASRAAHDIKNPLSSIIISAESLQKKLQAEGNERSVRLINIALRSAKNLVTYVDDMLNYSKAPSSLIAAQENFELETLLDKVIQMLNVPEVYSIKMPQNALVKSSRIALEQILLNLLSNAIRYNDKAEPEIIIDFKENATQYLFNISDNGIGIAEEDLSKIFEAGYVSAEKDRFNKNGNGLGLDSVFSLIKKLKGEINVSSTLGKGTKVSFGIPKL
ncbi:GAF domain-containing sensor histidine kinase [Pedobacter nototheniae]|uniref:GAF domain-containing sensor histidine kinase n=1 Tax=Pedobacter nototheniae TaxID=2488994 RepID=UPI00292F249D|nr:GAF domain-containing sensor histidine kinase [Pedobacter nototheniae]